MSLADRLLSSTRYSAALRCTLEETAFSSNPVSSRRSNRAPVGSSTWPKRAFSASTTTAPWGRGNSRPGRAVQPGGAHGVTGLDTIVATATSPDPRRTVADGTAPDDAPPIPTTAAPPPISVRPAKHRFIDFFIMRPPLLVVSRCCRAACRHHGCTDDERAGAEAAASDQRASRQNSSRPFQFLPAPRLRGVWGLWVLIVFRFVSRPQAPGDADRRAPQRSTRSSTPNTLRVPAHATPAGTSLGAGMTPLCWLDHTLHKTRDAPDRGARLPSSTVN